MGILGESYMVFLMTLGFSRMPPERIVTPLSSAVRPNRRELLRTERECVCVRVRV